MSESGEPAVAAAGVAAAPGRRKSFAALGHRDFRLYTLAYFLATVAIFMQGVALG